MMSAKLGLGRRWTMHAGRFASGPTPGYLLRITVP